MVRPMRKTRAPTQSQRAIGHIAALQSIATMFVMHAMVGRSTLQFKMPRLDAYLPSEMLAVKYVLGMFVQIPWMHVCNIFCGNVEMFIIA